MSRDTKVIYLSSDGSKEDVGAYAVALCPGENTYATGNGDEDRSPYKQEVLGLRMASIAARRLAEGSAWDSLFLFVSDCQAVMRAFRRDHNNLNAYNLPHLVREIQENFAAIRRTSARVRMVWVPSHGKKPCWEAPPELCTDFLRLLNDRADESGRACMERRRRGSARARRQTLLQSSSD